MRTWFSAQKGSWPSWLSVRLWFFFLFDSVKLKIVRKRLQFSVHVYATICAARCSDSWGLWVILSLSHPEEGEHFCAGNFVVHPPGKVFTYCCFIFVFSSENSSFVFIISVDNQVIYLVLILCYLWWGGFGAYRYQNLQLNDHIHFTLHQVKLLFINPQRDYDKNIFQF